jgi:hypothetical protein
MGTKKKVSPVGRVQKLSVFKSYSKTINIQQ